MDSNTPSAATPMRRIGLPARSRKKYAAVRAFYVTIAVILFITLWAFAIGRERSPARSGKVFLPRHATATSEGFYQSAIGLVRTDHEVYGNPLKDLPVVKGS